MDNIIFGPNLALGIPVLDQSHRFVFDMLEQMNKLSRPAFDQACGQLTLELVEHLREEDRLMKKIAYAAAPAHLAAHRELLESISQVLHLLRAGDEGAARQIVQGLPDWLEAHINTMDLALAVAVSRVEE